jgi:orotate phosphoribosyltransferase
MQTEQDFIEFCLSQNILRFGDFTLKSGRQSPYFFNAGLFDMGQSLARLGEFYAEKILSSQIDFDVLFGPAYKGIPLATTTAIALSKLNKNIAVSFNRKEAKSHGEKGHLIGASLAGKKVLVIDDVITAGTAFHEAKNIITEQNGSLVGVIIALDRQEKGKNNQSALTEISNTSNIPVLSIAKLDGIKNYLELNQETEKLAAIIQYQKEYGI